MSFRFALRIRSGVRLLPGSFCPLIAVKFRERRANALRLWLRRDHQAVPSEAQLQQLLDQVEACRTRGHRIHLKVAGGFVAREGEGLRWYNAPPSPALDASSL